MTTRHDIAAAFKQARPLIASEQERFICVALTFGRFHPLKSAGEAAEEIVMERIEHGSGGYFTLDTWVTERVLHGHQPSLKDMQAFRLRWLDSLIVEFSQNP